MVIDKLLYLLKKLECDDTVTSSYDEEEHRTFVNEHPLIDEIEGLACEFLIASNGQCNYENMAIMRENGYRVFAGEQDSFGWLTGCIKTKKGIIVYG